MEFYLCIGNGVPCCSVKFDIDQNQLKAEYYGDIAYLTFNTTINVFQNQLLTEKSQLALLSLDGTLFQKDPKNPHQRSTRGANLIQMEGLPLPIQNVGQMRFLNLTFEIHKSILHLWEKNRTIGGSKQDLQLNLNLWGNAMYTPASTPINDQNQLAGYLAVSLQSNVQFRIPRSDWIDQYLPQLGYPYKKSIELPTLDKEDLPEEIHSAIEHLEAARSLFDHEDYRAAVNRCRQVRDALLSPEIQTWCQENLTPVLGKEKSDMVDGSIKALNHLGNAASHGKNPIEIDRESAEFVISSLFILLNYIGKKIR